jgi:hypothetical protein
MKLYDSVTRDWNTWFGRQAASKVLLLLGEKDLAAADCRKLIEDAQCRTVPRWRTCRLSAPRCRTAHVVASCARDRPPMLHRHTDVNHRSRLRLRPRWREASCAAHRSAVTNLVG